MKLPGRNFARFILMLFVLFSLVMRTAYQGKQFEFIQKEMRKKNVQTIDELVKLNYTLTVKAPLSSYGFEEMDFFQSLRHVKIVDSSDSYLQEHLTLTFDSKKFFVTNKDFLILAESHLERKLNVLPEPLMTNNVAFFFFRTDFIYEPFNRKLTQLIESGIARKVSDKYESKADSSADESGPVVLTLDHLGIGFVVWLGFLLISFVALLVELILRYMLAKYSTSKKTKLKKIPRRKAFSKH